ncbi:MAG TPA: GT-D fold domain-containing glycosyltransferase [Bacillota bacterium]
MALKDIPDSKLLSELEVLKKINEALKKKKPFSLVRVGDGENIVLGQYTFLPEKEFMNTYWIKESFGDRDKGTELPNTPLRDQMIVSLKKADIIGVCWQEKNDIRVPDRYKRELTNKIFDHYRIKPAHLCHVFTNRKLVSYQAFWRLLHNYRTLLISKWAKPFAKLIAVRYATLKPKIVGCLSFEHYRQIPTLLNQIGNFRFDLALVSAGVNAVVLTQQIAERYKKVAIDFGKAMMFMLKDSPRISPWLPQRAAASPDICSTLHNSRQFISSGAELYTPSNTACTRSDKTDADTHQKTATSDKNKSASTTAHRRANKEYYSIPL